MGKLSLSDNAVSVDLNKDDYDFISKISKHNLPGLIGDRIAY